MGGTGRGEPERGNVERGGTRQGGGQRMMKGGGSGEEGRARRNMLTIIIYKLMCVALPPTHVGGCTLYVGRSTMDDERLKIVDFKGKFVIRG